MRLALGSFAKRASAVLLAMLLMLCTCFSAGAISEDAAGSVPVTYDGELATVLFTHDLHSSFLPVYSEEKGEVGGYARLMTLIRNQKELYPDAILVDGGDFSMGSLFQTCFKTEALELRMMGRMGYDVTTLGNHEFDYLPQGLASMLRSAVDSKDALPSIVNANYLPFEEGQEGYNEDITDAFDYYPIKKYTILERGGIYFVVFGITGEDSDDCAPNSGMELFPAAEVSQQIVDEAKAECEALYGKEPVVVCLSHSGTEDGKGEDYELAKNVDGIDLIVSAHSHTTLTEPILVNDTVIASAGNYGEYLGVVHLGLSSDNVELVSYNLIPVNDNVEEDDEIAQLVQEYKEKVNETYLAPYGLTFDEKLVFNEYYFDSVKEVKATQHESTLGNLFSDAYKSAAEKALLEDVDIALTATGVIRSTVPKGSVTVSDVFNAASLGVGTEGELIRVYLTGKDLKNVFEVDASVQPIMKNAQLFISGAKYSFNTKRMIFNKVDSCCLVGNDGVEAEIEDDKLYSVVTGMYVGQMLGSVREKSFGLLSVVPRDKNGNPIDEKDFANYLILDENKNTVKEWYAIASYLGEMQDERMDESYAQPDGRKTVYKSVNPVSLLRGANVFTYVALVLMLIVLAVLVLIIVILIRRILKIKALKEPNAKEKKAQKSKETKV